MTSQDIPGAHIDPIIVDAADGGAINRKRLWWLSADWDVIQSRLVQHTPCSCQGSSDHRHWPRLHNPLARILQPDIDSSQCSAPRILQRQALFHCLTTPAPDIHGRPPPHHTAEDPNTMRLWQADNRRFAPWQYQDKYLVSKPAGSRALAPGSR